MQVVTNKGYIVLWNIHFVDMALLGEVYTSIWLQNSLHITTYVIISQEPIVVLPQFSPWPNYYSQENSKNLKQHFLNY